MKEISYHAIIPAAGAGRRTGMSINKPWIDLEGEPMVVRTLRKFVGLPGLEKVAIVVMPEELEQRRKEIGKHDLSLDLIVCGGGKRRQDSVEAGLDQLGLGEDDMVVVHDAARPFVPKQLIIDVVRAAAEGQAAIAAVKAEDTIKEIGEDGLVRATAPREKLRRAQTPQAIRAGIIRRGLALAKLRGIVLSDDAGSAELLGFRVAVVPGRKSNFKITTYEDVSLARYLIREGIEK
jgi:2-C-methyl-D-erythritol 4-phosphate cytidylyltransferase